MLPIAGIGRRNRRQALFSLVVLRPMAEKRIAKKSQTCPCRLAPGSISTSAYFVQHLKLRPSMLNSFVPASLHVKFRIRFIHYPFLTLPQDMPEYRCIIGILLSKATTPEARQYTRLSGA